MQLCVHSAMECTVMIKVTLFFVVSSVRQTAILGATTSLLMVHQI